MEIYAELESYSSNDHSWAEAEPMPFAIARQHRRKSASTPLTDQLESAVEAGNAAIGEDFAARQRHKELTRRISQLEVMFFEDYGMPLDRYSKAAFECFMTYSPMVEMPILGIEPTGVILATWDRGVECLSLRFSDRYRLDYAVTFMRGGEVVREWDRSSLGTIFTECPTVKRLASV